jgi:hypothetical protein
MHNASGMLVSQIMGDMLSPRWKPVIPNYRKNARRQLPPDTGAPYPC